MRLRQGLRPRPHWGAHDAPPYPLVGWGGDTCPRLTPLGASTLVCPLHIISGYSTAVYIYVYVPVCGCVLFVSVSANKISGGLHLTDAQKKLVEEDAGQTLAQQENMQISGSQARQMVMQKLLRANEVCITCKLQYDLAARPSTVKYNSRNAIRQVYVSAAVSQLYTPLLML